MARVKQIIGWTAIVLFAATLAGIWVLTEKGVEEQGSHAELIAKGGLYAHLFAMYTSDR